jgi:mono/diheme cytochrome c family protein
MRDEARALIGLALVLAAAPAGAELAGAALFVQTCSACHQADGAGTPGLAPPLKGTYWQKLLAERSYLPRVIAFGLTGRIEAGNAVFNSGMPAQTQLSDDQLAAIANHVAATLNAASLPLGWKSYVGAEIATVRATRHASIDQRQLRKQLLTP